MCVSERERGGKRDRKRKELTVLSKRESTFSAIVALNYRVYLKYNSFSEINDESILR